MRSESRTQNTEIIIGGDLCPTGRATSLFQNGNVDALFANVLQPLHEADLTIVNLECCLITQETPIEKDGPLLGVPVGCAKGLKAAGIDIVGISNNHILDHGAQGLQSTIAALRQYNIGYFGAGPNLSVAREMLIREIDGLRIAFLGMAEHEFSIAGCNTWGANPLDLIDYVRNVKQNRYAFDVLIVLVHGGKEHYPYPTPKLMDVCRFFIEEGANAVICQHSHCAGCYEIYKGAPIVYGQGNFVFDRKSSYSTWYEGFLVRLTIKHNFQCLLDLIPFSQFGSTSGVTKMSGAKRKQFLDEIEVRSQSIKSFDFIRHLWLELCQSEKQLYFSRLHGHSRIMRIINRAVHFSDWFYSRRGKMMIRNVVECETHREALETLWRQKNGKRR